MGAHADLVGELWPSDNPRQAANALHTQTLRPHVFMMMALTGRERTEAEFVRLLAEADLRCSG